MGFLEYMQYAYGCVCPGVCLFQMHVVNSLYVVLLYVLCVFLWVRHVGSMLCVDGSVCM